MSSIEGGCPPDTQVGVDWAGIKPSGESAEADFQLRFPVYNLVPPPGVPAEFGFSALGSLVLIDAGVRSGGDYGITGAVDNLSYQVTSNSLTFWGVPDEAVHNYRKVRPRLGRFAQLCGYKGSATVPKPLFTLPTSCEGPQTVRTCRPRAGMPKHRSRPASSSSMTASGVRSG